MGWNSCVKFGDQVQSEKGNVWVDFSLRPVDVLSSVTCWLLNARRQKKNDVGLIYKFLLRYIMLYPIVAACSVKVKDRNTKFVEEYVFPQRIKKKEIPESLLWRVGHSGIYGGITTMVIVSKYRLERNEEKDIFSNQ